MSFNDPSRQETAEDRRLIGDNVTPTSSSQSRAEKGRQNMVDTPVPLFTWRTIFLGLLTSMGGFIFGYDTGQISGFIGMDNFINQFGSGPAGHRHFTNVRSGLIVALLSIGTLMGALVAAPIADRIGRKWSLSAWCVVLFVGIIVQITSHYRKWYQVMIGRWIAGLSVGALSLLVPLYMSEIAPRHVRGGMVATYQLFITLGIFVANCINYGTEDRRDTSSWRIPMGITVIWGFILGTGILFFPETPRYEYRRNRRESARKTLRNFYGIPDNHVQLQVELEEIHEKCEEDVDVYKEPWHRMFVYPTMPTRLFVGTALQGLQQLTGANYYFYYATTVFQGAGIKNDYVTQMILGGVNFGTTFLGLYFIERFGRRQPLFWGAIWMFCCFICYASVGHFSLNRDKPEKSPGAGKALVVFSCLFILGYASTWGPMIWAVIAELYPSRYRARAMAIPTAMNWTWNFLISFFTPFIVSAIDFMYGYVFAGCLFLAAVLIYFGVMETKGRTLEEIDTMYKLGVLPWKSAGFVVPRPEEEASEKYGQEQEESARSKFSSSNTGPQGGAGSQQASQVSSQNLDVPGQQRGVNESPAAPVNWQHSPAQAHGASQSPAAQGNSTAPSQQGTGPQEGQTGGDSESPAAPARASASSTPAEGTEPPQGQTRGVSQSPAAPLSPKNRPTQGTGQQADSEGPTAPTDQEEPPAQIPGSQNEPV
ncbi:hexose transporter hxt1 [Ascosphaera atra]|nr:hexose transporter hxt1 [Ascosphaera atra]